MSLSFFKRSKTSDKHDNSSAQQSADEDTHSSSSKQPKHPKRADSPVSPVTPSQEQDADDFTTPILDENDELFLRRIASEGEPPPLPPRRTVIDDEGRELDLSRAPSRGSTGGRTSTEVLERDGKDSKDGDGKSEKESKKEQQKRLWNEWLFVPAVQGKEMVLSRMGSFRKGKDKDKSDTDEVEGDAKAKKDKGKSKKKPDDAAGDVKDGDGTGEDAEAIDAQEAIKEKKDLNSILSSLNLNNRMMSLSEDSRKLLDEFVLVLKDIVNGVPTAYDDMEKLLKNREKQLSQLYGSMPPFLQTLVKSLPMKMWAALAPEFAAAANADQSKDGRDRKRRGSYTSSGGEGSSKEKDKKSSGKKTKYALPTLRALISQKGAVTAMLRSIVGFLQMRFPALLAGTNVLLGLAVFVLLFVFWYCWKRGRETRLGRDDEDRAESSSNQEKEDVDRDRDGDRRRRDFYQDRERRERFDRDRERVPSEDRYERDRRRHQDDRRRAESEHTRRNRRDERYDTNERYRPRSRDDREQQRERDEREYRRSREDRERRDERDDRERRHGGERRYHERYLDDRDERADRVDRRRH